jgi:hypothetical protein
MKFKINYDNIKALSIGFTRADSLVAKGIQLVRKGLNDKSFPNHSFIVTSDWGQLFATEETFEGLKEQSLERYIKSNNRIVAMYYWNGFNGTKGIEVQKYLSEIRRKYKEESKYDLKGILYFVPLFNKFIKPDSKKQWCSENCASILKNFGAEWITKTEIAPDELLELMQNNDECECILNYYDYI